ncbi:MAG: hypothetical protein LBC73_01285 [Oscillospiraceae bacterium]|nr:hypothetical protein [Oscillospiraceae bacterium]
MKKIRILYIVIVTIILISVFLTGCYNQPVEYTGDYPELFTIAINSLIGSKGFSEDPYSYEVVIEVVEIDDYGRKLFLYIEFGAQSNYSLLISQTSNDEYVYFYPHYNFITVTRGIIYAQPNKVFSPEEIEKLKKNNDWNQELKLDNAVRARIVRIKPDRYGPIGGKELNRAYRAATGGSVFYRLFFNTDNYGRSIYLIYGISRKEILLFFQADGSLNPDIGIMEIHNRDKYQTDLRLFKEANGWNMPYP